MNENQRIGERLEAERKRLGFTAVEIYNSLDIAQTTYKGYELGKRDIPAGLLARLWDMGFDVLYIVTGVYAESASTSNQVIIKRLVTLPDNRDMGALSDTLLVAMYHAEEALIQAGAVAGEDYNYNDLLMSASVMQQQQGNGWQSQAIKKG